MSILPNPAVYKQLDNSVVVEKDADDRVIRAVGTTSLDELRYSLNVTQPSVLETNKKDKCFDLRNVIQRKFISERAKNRDDFASYILDLADGRPGALPPLTLFTPDHLAIDSNGHVLHDIRSCVIAIDGETQLDAMWKASETNPSVSWMPLSYVMHAGISLDEARIIVHDLNALGRAIKESEVVSLNSNSPVNMAIASGVTGAGYSMDNIDRSGDGVGTKYNPKLTSFQRLASLAAGVHSGRKRINERTDAFLNSFIHPGSMPPESMGLISTATAQLCALPREQRVALGKVECKILGAFFAENQQIGITTSVVATMLANKARNKGKRMGAKAKYTALTADM